MGFLQVLWFPPFLPCFTVSAYEINLKINAISTLSESISKAMLGLVDVSDIKGRGLCLCCLIKFSIGLRLDICKTNLFEAWYDVGNN